MIKGKESCGIPLKKFDRANDNQKKGVFTKLCQLIKTL